MFFDISIWAVIGALGIWAIEASYLPQILRLYRRKEARDISLLFPSLNLAGRVMASAYAFHMGVDLLALGFVAGCLLRATLLGEVVYYRWVYTGQGRVALALLMDTE